MNAINQFIFKEQPVRVVEINGAPWFVAKDVCQILGIQNNSDAVSRLDGDERGLATTDTLGGPQEITVVSESGLYSLIFQSRKPEAKTFRKWVTSEVLPSLRKTGHYEMPGQDKSQSASYDELPVDSGEWLAAIRQGKRLYGADFARALWEQSTLPQPTDYINENTVSLKPLDGLIADFLRDFCSMTGHSRDFISSSKLIDKFQNWAKESGFAFGRREVSLALKRVTERYVDPSTGNRPRRVKRAYSGYSGVRMAA